MKDKHKYPNFSGATVVVGDGGILHLFTGAYNEESGGVAANELHIELMVARLGEKGIEPVITDKMMTIATVIKLEEIKKFVSNKEALGEDSTDISS